MPGCLSCITLCYRWILNLCCCCDKWGGETDKATTKADLDTEEMKTKKCDKKDSQLCKPCETTDIKKTNNLNDSLYNNRISRPFITELNENISDGNCVDNLNKLSSPEIKVDVNEWEVLVQKEKNSSSDDL
jgi:hypothetical protein